jgi:thiamine-monophosphate kinase
MPTDEQRAAIYRHLRPTARVGEGAVLARLGATAMMDISDGLSLDLSRLARASGVGVRLALDLVPLASLATMADAMGGGEDYELLATLPGADEVASGRAELRESFGVELTEIGVVTGGDGMVGVDTDGAERPLEVSGWDHFA